MHGAWAVVAVCVNRSESGGMLLVTSAPLFSETSSSIAFGVL